MAETPFDLFDQNQITGGLQRLLGRAVMLTMKSNENIQVLQINFTTLLVAFLVADDRLSQWFQDYVEQTHINAERIYRSKRIEPTSLEVVRKTEFPEEQLKRLSQISVSTDEILREANELRSHTSRGKSAEMRLDVCHVMGAYIYRPGQAHTSQLADWGFDREAWSNAFLQAFGRVYPDRRAEIELWQDIHTETFGSPPAPERIVLPAVAREQLPGYDADAATGKVKDDLLDISPDVNALAALIAAKDTSPSLAVGVFGDWGSGKTFFMRSLMRRIDELTQAARSETESGGEWPQKDVAFYKRIVQIEFNAWHYVEGNLWASLVEHIFSNLRVSQDPEWDPDGTKIETLQKHLLEQLKVEQSKEEQARKDAEEAERKRQEAEKRRKEIETDRAQKLQELTNLSVRDVMTNEDLSPVMDVINTALKAAGFPEVAQKVEEVGAALTEARTTLQHGGAVFAPLFRADDRSKRFRLLLVALLAGPVIGLVGSLIGWLIAQPAAKEIFAQISGIVSGSAAFLGLLANWLQKQVQWTSENLAKIEQANQKLADLQASKLAAYDAEIAKLRQEASALDADYLAAVQVEQAAQQRVQGIQQQIRQALPVHRLAHFIQDRTDSDDYRKHLGLLALIRRDFQVLSDYIDKENQRIATFESVADEADGANVCINRIVLYIDDLDRCPPHKVVQVLQAVHLLLAFPLFVVVVGVDARWVSHSLEQRYPHLLRGNIAADANNDTLSFGRDATPHDYLEKIFQIPIWLMPVGEAGSRKMLDGLLGDKVMTRQKTEAIITGGEAQQPGPSPEPLPSSSETPGPLPLSAAQTLEARRSQKIDLTPKSLDIYHEELGFMKELGSILGRSPRAIKRFVNLYRLIKGTLDQTSEPLSLEEEEPVSDYQVVMFLLAVVTGMPGISRQLFQIIRRGEHLNRQNRQQDETPLRSLSWVMEQLDISSTGAAKAERDRLLTWLNNFRHGSWLSAALTPFARRAWYVARYSFRVEQIQL